METVVVGARGSRLAQVMVRELIDHLGSCPVVAFKARSVMTDGDKDRKTPLQNLGGAEGGVFTTRLEEELLAGGVDIAVHSLKDLPTSPPNGLVLAVTPPRADPLDALCGSTLAGLRPGARVGTGSARRIAQLKALRPDVEIVPIRGNVPPRLARLKSGLDAVILAASGLRRLGLDDAITELLDPSVFPPSPGQGALAVQVRAGDSELGYLVRRAVILCCWGHGSVLRGPLAGANRVTTRSLRQVPGSPTAPMRPWRMANRAASVRVLTPSLA